MQLARAREFPTGPHNKALGAEVIERCTFLVTDLAAFAAQRKQEKIQQRLRRIAPKTLTTPVSQRVESVDRNVDNGKSARFEDAILEEALQVSGQKRKLIAGPQCFSALFQIQLIIVHILGNTNLYNLFCF
jgi:hypothetical protein